MTPSVSLPRPTRTAHRRAPLARLGALAAATLLGASACIPGLPGVPSSVTDAPAVETRPPANRVPVRIGKAIRGDLTGVVTFAGEVRPKGHVAVVPRVAARLDRVYVDIGARVREGEPLADLDRSELEVQVLQAQAAQAAAEARLAQLKAGPRPEALAQGQANLRAAQARLQALESSRQAASDPAALQQRIEAARARVQRAEAASQPNPQAIAQADAAVQAARTRFNQLLADPVRGNDRQQVEAARDEVRRAEEAAANARANAAGQAALESARRELSDAEQAFAFARLSFNAFDLDQARALVDAADAQVKLLGAPASADEVRAAEAAVEQAFALAELSRIRLRDTTVTSPINGIVTELHATPGSMVGPTGPILTLIPPELQVQFHADESQAAQIQPGQSATLSVESLPQESFNGVIKAIAPVLDPRTRTAAVRVEVPDPRGKLRAGMFVQIAVQTAQRRGVVLVPREAVVRVPSPDPTAPLQNAVYLVADSRVRRTRVLLGAGDARNVEVITGVNEGADVVLSPRPDLIDGELVSGS